MLGMKLSNCYFKTWVVLQQVWRHLNVKHTVIFRSVATIMQLEIQNGRPLFQVSRYEDKALA